MAHRTWHCSVSGACHVSCPLGFGAVDHWGPLSSSCTGQSGGTLDMSGASWHQCSDFWPSTVRFCSRPLCAGDLCSVGSPDTVRCTLVSPVNYSRAPLENSRVASSLVPWPGHRTVFDAPLAAPLLVFASNLVESPTEFLSWFMLNFMHLR
jgi:hypothetical protein